MFLDDIVHEEPIVGIDLHPALISKTSLIMAILSSMLKRGTFLGLFRMAITRLSKILEPSSGYSDARW